MKLLDEEGVGVFIGHNEKEKVFFKKVPTQCNKEMISKQDVDFGDYERNFKMNIEHMTTTQINRLLNRSPDKDKLVRDYGYNA